MLELGCGDASLWSRNVERIPANMDILLTDISYGMIRDAARNLSDNGSQFRYEAHRVLRPGHLYMQYIWFRAYEGDKLVGERV